MVCNNICTMFSGTQYNTLDDQDINSNFCSVEMDKKNKKT